MIKSNTNYCCYIINFFQIVKYHESERYYRTFITTLKKLTPTCINYIQFKNALKCPMLRWS